MKIETRAKIIITLDEKEYTLTRSEAQELYNKLKKELEIPDDTWKTIPLPPLAPLKTFPLYPSQPPSFPNQPGIWY